MTAWRLSNDGLSPEAGVPGAQHAVTPAGVQDRTKCRRGRLTDAQLEQCALIYRRMERDPDPGMKWSEDQKQHYRDTQAQRAEVYEELLDRRHSVPSSTLPRESETR